MLILLDVVTATGIIFAFGHFYFALVYDAKKYGAKNTVILTLVSLAVTASGYVLCWYFPSSTNVNSFSLLAIILFIFHNLFDFFRFGYIRLSLLGTIAGMVFLYLFFWHYPSQAGILGAYGIWILVFSHYLFWIILSIKKFDAVLKQRFIHQTIIVHVIVMAGYLLGELFRNELLQALYSLALFYFMTLAHVVFSTLRQLVKRYYPKVAPPRPMRNIA